ncbi:hypothetical protein HanPI659440_Chr00c08g0720161 [Helianthus annuus]|nr:hypothetical protein HanPI659440_Chr00c08g0720161 [Helianthus annuus]
MGTYLSSHLETIKRYRYGDEVHLDQAMKCIFQYALVYCLWGGLYAAERLFKQRGNPECIINTISSGKGKAYGEKDIVSMHVWVFGSQGSKWAVLKSGLWRRVVRSLHNNSQNWNFMPVKFSNPGPWKQLASISCDLEEAGWILPPCSLVCRAITLRYASGRRRGFMMSRCSKRSPISSNETQKKHVLVSMRVKVVDGANTVNFGWSRQRMGQSEEAELNELVAAIRNLSLNMLF